MIQVTHLGRRTSWSKDDWLPVVAPSNVREPAHRAFPKVMEDWDIRRTVAAYADAAERIKAGGLDGFELECYGHLIDQFWSPATNKRDDEYGGSLENRMRFAIEVLEAIRARVGPDFIVGTRMVCDEDWDRGLSKAEGLEIARRLVASGLIDFVNVIRATSTPKRRSPTSSPTWGRARPRTSISPARSVARPRSRPFTRPASRTWRRPAMPSRAGSSISSA